MANGNGRNGPYEELRGRIKAEAAKRPPMPRMAREEWLAKQQAAMQQRSIVDQVREKQRSIQDQNARGKLLLPEEQAFRRANARRVQRRRTDDQMM